MAEDSEETEVVTLDENAKVKHWRIEQLMAAGFSRDLAQVVAGCPDIDLHKAIDMVEAGGKPSVVALILL